MNIINKYVLIDLIERKVFFENFYDFFFLVDYYIIGGDFNCYESDLDKFGSNVFIV